MLRATYGSAVVPLMSYLFGSITKYEFRSLVENHKEVWAAAENNGYLQVNCKLYGWARYKAKVSGVSVSPGMFDIERVDVRLLGQLDLKHLSVVFPALTLAQFKALETQIFGSRDLNDYVGKFINKKLRFLYSYGQTFDQLKATLFEHGIKALRKRYPRFDSPLHAMNSVKTSIHHAGIGLIYHHTRESRNELRREADGTFQSLKVPFDSLQIPVAHYYDDQQVLDAQALRTVLARITNPRTRGFLAAAIGHHDRRMSSWIGMDNRDAMELWSYDRYRSQLRACYGATGQQELRLFETLRNLLS